MAEVSRFKVIPQALPNLANGKVWQGNASNRPEETIPAGGGDMLAATYDPDTDGIIALAELDPLVCSEAEAAALIAAHAGNAAAHHAKYTDAEADARIAIHAADYNLHSLIVLKTADETVNNSAVLQNDDELLFPIGANEIWLVHIFLMIDSSASADFQAGWAYPVGCDIKWANGLYWDNVAAGTLFEENQAQNKACQGIGSVDSWCLVGIISNGANAGNINLQWAQQVAEASNTKVLTNSCLIAYQLT